MSTITDPATTTADEMLDSLGRLRSEQMVDLLSPLRRARADLKPLLDEAEQVIYESRQMCDGVYTAMKERYPDNEGLVGAVHEVVSLATGRYELFDVLADLAGECDPDERWPGEAGPPRRRRPSRPPPDRAPWCQLVPRRCPRAPRSAPADVAGAFSRAPNHNPDTYSRGSA